MWSRDQESNLTYAPQRITDNFRPASRYSVYEARRVATTGFVCIRVKDNRTASGPTSRSNLHPRVRPRKWFASTHVNGQAEASLALTRAGRAVDNLSVTARRTQRVGVVRPVADPQSGGAVAANAERRYESLVVHHSAPSEYVYVQPQ